MPVQVLAASATQRQVISIRPVIIDATRFELVAGLEKLREIAGLASIATMVPDGSTIRLPWCRSAWIMPVSALPSSSTTSEARYSSATSACGSTMFMRR